MEIVFIFALIVGMILLQSPALEWFNRLNEKRQFKKFLSQETFYHSVISKYFRYYSRLPHDEQRKFLFRTFLFRKAKKFHYIEVTETPEMPILVSAVCAQLTLGLE
jgi:hypothetical protein